MWALLLLASTGILFLVPMLPALLELRLRRDAQPLVINPEHTGHVRYFADAFQDFLGRSERETLPARLNATRQLGPRELVLAETSCLLPDHAQCDQEILANNALETGINSRYRSVLAKSHLVIRRNSVLLRWAHGRSVGIEDGCLLLGRLSADERIVIRKSTRFTRLNAPCVVFGDAAVAEVIGSDIRLAEDRSAGCQAKSDPSSGKRRICNGDFELPEGSVTMTDLIVRGALRIGRGATVLGSIKSQGGLILEPGVTVTGALVSEGRLTIGDGCRLGGPVVAEWEIFVGSDVVVGASERRATITAPEIRVAEGTIVHGTVWAREQGWVIAREAGA